MKKLLLALCAILFLVPAATTAQVKWKIPKSYRKKQIDKKGNILDMKVDYLQGKWQEVNRTPAGSSTPVSYTDTMFITVTDREAIVKQGNNMTMKGEAKVQDRMFTAAADYFEILNLRNTEMTLRDDEFTRKMQRMDSYYFESFGHDSVNQEQFLESIAADPQLMSGNWMIYRKRAEPGKTTLAPVLETVNISRLDGATGSGEVSFNNGTTSEKQPATFSMENRQLNIKTDKHSWTLDVYKANGKELVLGEKQNILYFAIH